MGSAYNNRYQRIDKGISSAFVYSLSVRMIFDKAFISEIGGRSINEDAAAIFEDHKMVIAAVADGLGGHGSGDIASKIALETLRLHLGNLKPPLEESLRTLCVAMNQAVVEAQKHVARMKTTLALALVDEDTLVCMHIGDSRVYHFHDGQIRYQSLDHSVSQLAVFAGEIKPDQIRFYEDRNRVLCVLGDNEGVNPEIHVFQHTLQPGDSLLTCTDGFWEYVREEEMLSALYSTRSAAEWLSSMRELIRLRASQGSDNYSAAAIRFFV